jgi:hypothetical protein
MIARAMTSARCRRAAFGLSLTPMKTPYLDRHFPISIHRVLAILACKHLDIGRTKWQALGRATQKSKEGGFERPHPPRPHGAPAGLLLDGKPPHHQDPGGGVDAIPRGQENQVPPHPPR